MPPTAKGPPLINGWLALFHPVFGQRYAALRGDVQRLKRELPAEMYVRHSLVKLFGALHRLVTQLVPADPNAAEFRLGRDLAKFRRAKGRGLPPRHRLFWVFSQKARIIIFLYVNDEATLRKAGAGTDPYEVFKRLVARGKIGADFEANLAAWKRVQPTD